MGCARLIHSYSVNCVCVIKSGCVGQAGVLSALEELDATTHDQFICDFFMLDAKQIKAQYASDIEVKLSMLSQALKGATREVRGRDLFDPEHAQFAIESRESMLSMTSLMRVWCPSSRQRDLVEL